MTFHNTVMLVCNVQCITQIHPLLTELIAPCYHSYSNFNGHEHLYAYSGVPDQAAIWFSIKTENQWQSRNLSQLISDLKCEMRISTFSITETASKAKIYLKEQIFLLETFWYMNKPVSLQICPVLRTREEQQGCCLWPLCLTVTPSQSMYLAPVVNRILLVHTYSSKGKRWLRQVNLGSSSIMLFIRIM